MRHLKLARLQESHDRPKSGFILIRLTSVCLPTASKTYAALAGEPSTTRLAVTS